MDCYLCNSPIPKKNYAQVGDETLLKCSACGLIWLSEFQTKEIADLYQDESYHTEKGGSGFEIDGFLKEGLKDGLAAHYDRHRFQPLFREVMRRNPKAQSPQYLDVGCSAGLLLAIARAHGWSVQGVETAPLAAKVAREKLKLNVEQKDIERVNFSRKRFDAISLFHVVEHLPDPRTTLRHLSSLLNDNGVLAIEVPNIGSLPARIRKSDWHGYVLPYHLWHFSHSTLCELLDQSGYNILGVHTPYVPCSGSHIVNVHQGLSRLLRAAKDRMSRHKNTQPNRNLSGGSRKTFEKSTHIVQNSQTRSLMEKAVRGFYWPVDMSLATLGWGEVLYVLAEKKGS